MELLTKENILTCMMFLLGAGVLLGFFKTKEGGFGPFNTSTLVVILVVLITAIFFSQDMVDEKLISNMIFSVIGFAAGIFTSKKAQ